MAATNVFLLEARSSCEQTIQAELDGNVCTKQ